MNINSDLTSKITQIFSNGRFEYYPEIYAYNDFELQYNYDIIKTALSNLIKIYDTQLNLYEKFRQKGFRFFSYAQIIFMHKIINNQKKCELIPYIRIGLLKGPVSLFREIPITENLNKEVLEISYKLYSDIKNIDNCSIIKKSKYDVVLSSSAASYLIHEIFGHLLEEDESHKLLSMIKENKNLLDNNFTLRDDPYYNQSIHFGSFDDSGKKYKDTTIIENGMIKGYINNKRRNNPNNPCLDRMTNLILSYHGNFEKPNLKKFLYIDYVYHGYINYLSGEFHLFSTFGKIIQDGKECKQFKNLIISGTFNELFNRIKIYDNKVNYSLGHCIKKNQMIIVGMASPSLYIKNISVR